METKMDRQDANPKPNGKKMEPLWNDQKQNGFRTLKQNEKKMDFSKKKWIFLNSNRNPKWQLGLTKKMVGLKSLPFFFGPGFLDFEFQKLEIKI